jgi:hypothetical protein
MDNDRMAEYQYMQRQESEDEPLTEHQAQEADREKAMEALRSRLSVKLSDPPTEYEALGMAVSAILTHIPHSELTGENYTEPYSNTTKLGAAIWQTHIIASEHLNGKQVEPEAGYEPVSEHQALGLAIGALKQLPDYPVTEWYAGGHSSTHALLPTLEVVYKDAEAHKSSQHMEYKPPEIDSEPEM